MRSEFSPLFRPAYMSIVLLSFFCFNVFALKSQLLSRRGVLDFTSQKGVSYKTLYFDQKVSFCHVHLCFPFVYFGKISCDCCS